MFVTLPTYCKHWSPFIGEPETGEKNPVTLDKCIAWYDALMAFQASRNRPLPTPLDFDGTMAFLDQEERIARSVEEPTPPRPAPFVPQSQDIYEDALQDGVLY